jgi:hypothetical protein
MARLGLSPRRSTTPKDKGHQRRSRREAGASARPRASVFAGRFGRPRKSVTGIRPRRQRSVRSATRAPRSSSTRRRSRSRQGRRSCSTTGTRFSVAGGSIELTARVGELVSWWLGELIQKQLTNSPTHQLTNCVITPMRDVPEYYRDSARRRWRPCSRTRRR